MKTLQFTEHPSVIHLLNDLQQYRAAHPGSFIVSDLIDEKGHQYVDYVQEGGGVLGIALLGYTYVLEQMGIRFVSLAGTSAGAINTMLLAAMGNPDEEKAPSILELLANLDLNAFVDGKIKLNELLSLYEAVVKHGPLGTLRRKPALVYQVLKLFFGSSGFNPGTVFHQWIKSVLEREGINSTQMLRQRMNDFPALLHRQTGEGIDAAARLAIIASDITTQTKVEFPAMNYLYYANPETVHPADYVRASMSIPVFFRPFAIENVPGGKQRMLTWAEKVQYRGALPKKVYLVDGGVLSNFPVDVFHKKDSIPRWPTFGVKLGLDRVRFQEAGANHSILFNSFEAARQMRDFEFLHQNRDFSKLVSNIDIGDHNWINFDLPEEDKIDLFIRGARTAAQFLKNFNWEEYKTIRAQLYRIEREESAEKKAPAKSRKKKKKQKEAVNKKKQAKGKKKKKASKQDVPADGPAFVLGNGQPVP